MVTRQTGLTGQSCRIEASKGALGV